jgi:hypothetical protein
LAFVVAAALFVRSDFARRLAGNGIQMLAERALGEEVTIGAVTVSYFPPQVGLQGLVISHRADGQKIVAVRSVVARFGVRDWKPGLVELFVERPDVLLHVDADGLREFRDAATSGGDPPDAFPWMALTVVDGHLRVEGEDLLAELVDFDVATEDDGRLDIAWGGLTLARANIREHAGPTRFKHVTLEPDRVAVPALGVTFDHLSVEGSLAVEAGGPLGGDLSVRAALPAFTTDPEAPRSFVDGSAYLDVSLSGTTEAPVIDARLATENLVVWRIDSTGTPAALNLGAIVGPLHFSGHELVADRLELPWGDGRVSVHAVVDTDTRTLSGAVLAEGVHLGRILRQAGAFHDPWVDFPGDVEAHVTGTLDPFRLEGPFEVVLADLVVRNGAYDGAAEVMLEVPRGRVQGALALDANHIVLDATDTRFGPGHGRAWAEIGFGSNGPLRLRTELEDFDLAWLSPLGGAGLGGRAHVVGALEGPFDQLLARAELDVVDAEVLELGIADRLTARLDSDLSRLVFTELHGEIGQTRYLGSYTLDLGGEAMSMDTQLVIPEGRIRDLAGIFVDLGDLDGSVSGSAVLRGEPRRLTGEVHMDLADTRIYGEGGFEGSATAWMDDGILTIDDLALRRGAAGLLARGTVGRGYAMNVELLTDGFTLEGLDQLAQSPIDLKGELAAHVMVGGTLFDWEPRGRIRAQSVVVSGRAVEPSTVVFRTDPTGRLSWEGELLGRAATVAGRLDLHGAQAYDLHADVDAFPVDVLYPFGADGTRLEATLTGEIELAGHLGDDPTPVDIEGRFDTVRVVWNEHELRNDQDWVVAVHGRSVQVPGLSLTDGGRTRLGLEGWTTADGRVNFRGGGSFDLDLARIFAPGVSMAEGQATINAEFSPTAGPHGFRATLTTKDSAVRTDYFPNTFSGLGFTVTTNGDAYTLDGVVADVGGGRLTGGGTITADGGWPSAFDLQATLRDARVQYLDYLPPMVGNAELSFDGPVGDLLMAGTIDIDDMEFRDRIDWEQKIVALQASRLTDAASEERENYFSLDLSVHAPGTIRLRNNLADATARADLRIIGDTARPGMTGSVVVEPGGRAYLQDREFELTRGELQFRDPYAFDPELDFLLETDVSGREQDYHVDYRVSGPFSNWATATSSDPFLSQADINTLLLFGMTREEFEQYGGMAAAALAAQATDLLAAQVAANPAQFVDRWNLVSGVNARGTPTLDSNWRVVAAKEFLGFTATGELDLADYDLYLSLERRVTRNFFATAYFTTQEEGRSLDFGSAVGAELKYRWELD